MNKSGPIDHLPLTIIRSADYNYTEQVMLVGEHYVRQEGNGDEKCVDHR